jgi:hypothetical protein
MKKGTVTVLVVVSIMIMALIHPPTRLVGRWQETRIMGTDTIRLLYIFRQDSSVDLVINGKAFATGKYKQNADTLLVSDPGCNAAYWGSYHLRFSGEDSVALKAINDTCQGRHEGMSGVTLVKVKKF